MLAGDSRIIDYTEQSTSRLGRQRSREPCPGLVVPIMPMTKHTDCESKREANFGRAWECVIQAGRVRGLRSATLLCKRLASERLGDARLFTVLADLYVRAGKHKLACAAWQRYIRKLRGSNPLGVACVREKMAASLQGLGLPSARRRQLVLAVRAWEVGRADRSYFHLIRDDSKVREARTLAELGQLSAARRLLAQVRRGRNAAALEEDVRVVEQGISTSPTSSTRPKPSHGITPCCT